MKLNKIIQAMAGMLIAGATALTSAAPVVIYDSLGPAVSNLPSLGYQATSTSELGDRVAFGGTARLLDTVTVRMSTWALASAYGTQAAGYSHALTFNFYGAGSGSAPGAIIASKTIDAFIPFRPEAGGCGDSRWQDAAGNCFNGMAFDVAFDFSAMNVYLPDAVTFGLAFSTQSYGADPLGVNGPYNSLNFGLSSGAPTVGTDLNADGVFWNTSHQQFLTTGTAGVFGQDTDWSGSVPAVQITADVPEPASLALVGLGLAGAAFVRRRRSGIKN